MKDLRSFGFTELKTVDQAFKAIIQNLEIFKSKYLSRTEKISVEKSLGRILADNLISQIDVPQFNRSAMDGFAVIAKNTFGSNSNSPILLKLSGKIEIGDVDSFKINEFECIEISTGALMPDKADAVVKIEDTEIENNMVSIFKPVTPNKNVSLKGENITKGQKLLRKGHKIRPFDITTFLDLGISEIEVIKPLKIGIFSTGNELIPINKNVNLKKGLIIDSNRAGIINYINHSSFDITDLGIVNDDTSSITGKLEEYIEKIDMFITTGGTSVGTKDLITEIVSNNGKLIIHGIAIRPGKPFAFGFFKETPIMMLPGYPLAAFLNLIIIGIPILEFIIGTKILFFKETNVMLANRISSIAGYRDIVRLVRVKDELEMGIPVVDKLMTKGASILSSLNLADYLLIISEDIEGIEEGVCVTAFDLKHNSF
jgi:molybdopterin molybdotransferase